MFDKLQQAAEKAATSVSRRRFLVGIGKAAMTAAAVVAAHLGESAIAKSSAIVCGPSSSPLCRGKPVGSPCTVGRRRGRCAYPSACYCVTD